MKKKKLTKQLIEAIEQRNIWKRSAEYWRKVAIEHGYKPTSLSGTTSILKTLYPQDTLSGLMYGPKEAPERPKEKPAEQAAQPDKCPCGCQDPNGSVPHEYG